ncbi:MAG: sensor domain-containing diguanylate cyclase [Acidobacteriota bacterium]
MASIIASRYTSIRVLKDYQRSGEYLKAVLDSADSWAIIFTDNHGYVLSCSVGVEEIFHFTQKDAVGRDVLTLFDEPRLQKELLTFMKDESGSTRFQNHQVAQSRSDEKFYLDVNFQRVCDPQNQQIGFACIVQDITDKIQQEKKLKEQSLRDDLTRLYNQRGFIKAINRDIQLCKKLGCTMSLCFMDLDHLKRCNDTYGHLFGSRAIKEAAQIIQQNVRPEDTCCRYGGDEFVIMMPQLNKQQALPIIERIRVAISEHFDRKITGSFGIADLSENVQTVTELLAAADKALYGAKNQGRNKVVVAD